MAISAEEFMKIPLEELLANEPKCSVCGKIPSVLNEELITLPNGKLIDEDCYFEKFGDFIGRHPIALPLGYQPEVNYPPTPEQP